MTSIPLPPAVNPADLLAQQAIQATTQAAASPGATASADPAAVERFASLMNQAPPVSSGAAPGASGAHEAAQALQGEQDRMHALDNKLQSFTDAAPTMSIGEITAANIALTHEMTMTTTRLSLATTVTKKSSDSFNSLLKNQ